MDINAHERSRLLHGELVYTTVDKITHHERGKKPKLEWERVIL